MNFFVKTSWFCYLLIMVGCSTDVDLAGPYEEVGIVYGLLDQSKNEHVFRINKAFKGEGNAFLIAKIPDSSQFKSLDAKVEEWVNNQKKREWVLEKFEVKDKEDGDFYSDNVLMYHFFEEELNEEAKYLLEMNVNGKSLKSETALVRDFRILPPLSFPSSEITFAANSSGTNNTKYVTLKIAYESSEFGAMYHSKMVFSYWEYFENGDSLLNIFPINLGTQTPVTIKGQEKLETSLEGEQFYKLLKDHIENNKKEKVIKRVPLGLDFEFDVAGEALTTYMQVNKPSDDIVESRPQYTNIENGYGVFSSRFNKILKGKRLNKFSTKELCEGEITKGLKFCSDRIEWQNEGFYCK